MTEASGRAVRTQLEARIRERRVTLEEFIAYTEDFARSHQEPGTLSLRHLQRLIAGKQTPETIRPATARLLEKMFADTISHLLAPAKTSSPDNAESAVELQRMLDAARRVDHSVIALLYDQLTAMRRLDRQLGAIVVRDELTAKIDQVNLLMSHSLTPAVRASLAALLSEMHTLAGWQALDTGAISASWTHYEQSKSAATQTASPAYLSHAMAEQSFVLLDTGHTADAVELLSAARSQAEPDAPRTLRAWLAAANGEALAAHGQQGDSLAAFDHATQLLPDSDAASDERPYVALNPVHLARWRGHALARFGDPQAVTVLTHALTHLDPTFVRAETSLRVDLATALTATGEHEQARTDAQRASTLAAQLGSARQTRRLRKLLGALH